MSDQQDERSDKIIDFIHKHKAGFQVNFTRIEPIKKGKSPFNAARAVSVRKYQTKEKIVSRYYKHISRCIE